MSKKPYYTHEVITPEKALEYACLSIGNRAIRDGHVAMLAAAMVRGEYGGPSDHPAHQRVVT